MRQSRTYGSVGAPGEQSPRATRLTYHKRIAAISKRIAAIFRADAAIRATCGVICAPGSAIFRTQQTFPPFSWREEETRSWPHQNR